MNQLVFIPNTGHIYRRQEQTLANQIMKLIHQWNWSIKENKHDE